MSVDHYENFPVASLLCPPRLRPAVISIYRFARTADDIADEGNALPEERLAELSRYRQALAGAIRGQAPASEWPQVFVPLALQIRLFSLPPRLLYDLLDAFEQDIGNPHYADAPALLDYCSRSANPVGRLLLHLHAIDDAVSLRQSDAICTALQLINFWQDLSVDTARGRHYVTDADLVAHGLRREDLLALRDTPATRTLVRQLCAQARRLMIQGAPLAFRIPGRSGWELRFVVQGGLRILERIEAIDCAVLTRRPTLSRADALPLLWRALRMPATGANAA
jgi:squalene synthase HpnC